MTRSSLRRQFEEPPQPPKKYDAEKEAKEFKSAWLYGNIVLCLVVIFMCMMSVNWMNADITGEYVFEEPDQHLNTKNFPTNRYKTKMIDGIQGRYGGMDNQIHLSLTRGPLTMYGDLTVNSVQMNLLSNDAPRTSTLDLVFETSDYDVKLGHPKRRCSLIGEIKDGTINATLQMGGSTRKVKFVRDGMASIQKRIQQSPLFGHWKWPWEQSS